MAGTASRGESGLSNTRLLSQNEYIRRMGSPIMCDWVTASIVSESARNRLAPPFQTGRILKISPQGEVTQEFSSRSSSVGSYDSSLSFRAPYPFQLEMSGNPTKFLQGHNLFGSDDFENLFFVAGAMSAINANSPFPLPHCFNFIDDKGALIPKHSLTEFRPTRLDLTRSYRFENNETARAWLRTVGASAHSRHKNRLATDGTIYYGQTSSRWTFKIYHKFDEINSGGKGHQLSEKLLGKDRQALLDWSAGVVRFELTLRRKEIEKLPIGFNTLDVWKAYYSKIQFNENSGAIDMNQLTKVSPRVKMAYVSWKSGQDLRAVLPRNTFYNYRKILLGIGIDIAVPPTKEQLESEIRLEEIRWDPEPIEELMVSDFNNSINKSSYGF